MYKTVGYAITITNPNFYGNDVCGIWADWNIDGDLYDGSESITVSGGPEVFTATITPPANAIEGSTPLRIRIHYSYEEIVPCGNSFYGEVEDYTINVLPVPASPTFGITPAIKKYGDCPLNNLSPDYFTQTFTVQNLGPGPLTISNVSLTGGDVTQFILTDPHTYPVGLSGTSTIQFTVKFNPATIGPKATTLRIQSSAKTNHDVALSGTGIVYPPQNLSGVTTPANTNELDWDPPLPEGEVRYDNGVASGTYLVNEPSTATNYIDGDVSPVTTYFYGVTALYSGSQQSDISNVLSLITLADNSVTWTGNVSTEWNNADNWDSGSIPDATIKVIIPSDPVSNRFPVINDAVNCYNINIGPGAIVTVQSPRVLNINNP